MATILVVDDDHLVRGSLSRLLNEEGYFVIAVESGLRALKCLIQHRIDLVILDYLMPDMNGVVLMELIRDNWPKLSMIMLTGEADSISSHQAGMQGVTYLLKPFEKKLLLDIIVNILSVRPPVFWTER